MRALRKEHQIDLPPLKRSDFTPDARAAFENEFLPQVWNAIGDRHILLMLDEAIRLQEQIEAGKLDKSVFEYLRHLMQHSDRLELSLLAGQRAGGDGEGVCLPVQRGTVSQDFVPHARCGHRA